MSNRVSSLPTPGPRCQDWLAAVGVHTAEDLRQSGAPIAYRELVSKGMVKIHRMRLYALGDAVLGECCIILSRDRKRQLEEESEL
ncbi:MAG: hypothetical protein GWQ05_10800 [Verrucomicrobiaceae bacterium]|nr:hypothetical protein [Verrucomicrobiaceae bacterium]